MMNKKKLPFFITAFCCALFIVLTFVAMLTYPGGTWEDPNTIGYDFIKNFFSDLGSTYCRSGAPNIISHALFSIAVLIAGISLIPFFISVIQFFSENPVTKWVSRINCGLGFIVAISYIGIGFTPTNVNGHGHLICVLISFMGTLPLVGIYTILMFLNKKLPRYLVIVYLVLTLVSAFYIILMFFNLGRDTSIGLIISVVGQKIIIYTEMITIIIGGLGLAKYIETQKE
ncbi:MAG: hypothetical protein ACTSRI_04100 [Promethearchaeota archaeon]